MINIEVNVYNKDVSNPSVNLDAKIIRDLGWVEQEMIAEDGQLWYYVQGYGWTPANCCSQCWASVIYP